MNHNVYFWLKKDLTSEHRKTFEAELARLPRIAYLAKGYAGKPASTEERPVTDHSFDYSLALEFRSLADHEFYQKECIGHAHFVAACRHFFERVIVYDSVSLPAPEI